MSTPTLREATEEAAEILRDLIANIERHGMYSQESTLGFIESAHAMLATALTQAADAGAAEPVAWMDDGSTRNGSDGHEYRVVTERAKANMPRAASQAYITPLYAAPPAQQLQQAVARALAEQRDEILSLIDKIDDGEQPAYRHCQEAIRQQGTP